MRNISKTTVYRRLTFYSSNVNLQITRNLSKIKVKIHIYCHPIYNLDIIFQGQLDINCIIEIRGKQ